MKNVLIIDDENAARIAIEKLGNWEKYSLNPPVLAENGKEALDIMEKISPTLVFVDMNMPVMSGPDFLEKATLRYTSSAFIVISGYDDFSYAQQAIHYGADDYLLKPVEKDKLNQAIEKSLRRLFPDFTAVDNDSRELSANDVVKLIHETIDKDYGQNLRISDFADRYFFSREYLSRLFKSKYKTGIYDYLTEIRMKNAAELLTGTDLKVNDIAVRVGFCDTNYFSKAFHQYYDTTPSEYRRK